MPRNRSYVYFTSSAVSSRPLTGGFGCQRTPRRSLNTYVVSLGRVHDSATSASTGKGPGRTVGPALTFRSRLCVNDSIVIVENASVWCGSNPTGSSPEEDSATFRGLGEHGGGTRNVD